MKVFLILLLLATATPAMAQYGYVRPKGAVPIINGCNQNSGYPDCHPDRPYMYQGQNPIIVPYVPYMYQQRSAATTRHQ